MINIVPNNDEREHFHNLECWCDPDVEWAHPETNEIHANGPLIVHNSADCRESVEVLLDEGLSKQQNWGVFVPVEWVL